MAINQGFTTLTGYTPEDVLGKSSVSPELQIWADEADRLRLVEDLRRKGEVKDLEARFRLKNGEVRRGLMSARVLTIDGEPCILSITRDVAARREGRGSPLSVSETAPASLLTAAPAAIFSLDREGRIQAWNPAAEGLFGWTAEEIVGRPNPLVPPDIDAGSGIWLARSRDGDRVIDLETVLLKKDGSRVAVRVSSASLPAEAGDAGGIMAIATELARTRDGKAKKPSA